MPLVRYDSAKRLSALRALNQERAIQERAREAEALAETVPPAPQPQTVAITPMVIEEGRRLNTAELESRQILNAEGESRAIALGQESFLSGSPGKETWVTDPDSEISRTLGEWVSLIQTAGTSTLLVSAIDPPSPDPETDGVLWYDPSTGVISVWYNGEWVLFGSPAPSSPTPLASQTAAISVGGVATLIKLLDLPVPYFDGGNSYYTQFAKSHAVGWSSPDFFPFAVFFSPAQSPHADNLVAAGITHYLQVENNAGNVEYALAAGLGVLPSVIDWTFDQVDAEDGEDNPLVLGWNCGDEPEMVGGTLATVQAQVAQIHAFNNGTYAHLNIGNGILGLPLWAPTTADDMVRSADVASVDQYFYSAPQTRINAISSPFWPGPGTSTEEARRSAAYGWLADRMRSFQDAEEKKPYGVFVEMALPLVDYPGTYPDYEHITPPQIAGAAWSAIRHGARMILFFQHNNNGRDNFYSLSAAGQEVIRGYVTSLTAEVTALAAVIDGPTYEWDFGTDDVETMLKAYDGDAYIFAGPALLAPLPGGGSSDIEQTGTTLQFQFTDTAETGTVSSAITVPDDAELVVVAVSGLHGTNNGFAAMTFTKGGVDTAMTKATGGDASGASWQSAMFSLLMPDTGASKTLKWDWLGAASSGPRVVAVTFWRGIDLSEPIRDSDGVQDTSFPLETPTSVLTPAIAAADGDRMLAFVGMRNDAADGTAKINVWHHAARLEELTHSGIAEGALATGTPDGDCTVGFENISVASQAAVVAVTIKAATLEAITSTVEQTGASHYTNSVGSRDNTGTFADQATVPADCDLVLAVVSGWAGFANGYETVTMLKGGVDTPMVRIPGGDVDGTMWQTAMFYMVNPDTGPGNIIKWDWAGSSDTTLTQMISLTFWKGVDTADPIRDSAAVQTSTFPVETPMMTNREGDMCVTFFGAATTGEFIEGTIDTWKNVTLLEQLEHYRLSDGAWATASVIGSLRVGVNTVTNITGGALIGVILKPAAAVTPITPAADPPTVPRSTVVGSFTLPPDLAAATTVEVIGESRSIPITAGVFEDDFDEEWSHHNYRIAIP